LLLALLAVALGCAQLTACGSSSGDATKLLNQTFSGSHKITSGNLSLSLTLNPSGSSSLRGPIGLSFGGPFQSLGRGKLPESNFNISVEALGRTGTLGILSTGTNGYVTLQGTSYQLPPATFRQLESSFSQLESSPTTSSSASVLNKLGIQPLHWLVNPSVVGDENVGGAATTHIRAGINVNALLVDLNTFLQKASSLGVSGANRLPSALSSDTRNRIASQIKNPSFDVWTGKNDKTVRKLVIKLTVGVSGSLSTLLGGLRSADIGLNMQYANLNQPQTITAPTSVRPYSEFANRVRAFFSSLQSLIGSGASSGTNGASGSTGSSGSTTSPSTAGSSGSASSNLQRYSQCIQQAGGDVTKMQACAPLLNAK
jgi:hypothetical protein